MHDAVVLGVVIFGIFGDDERHLGDRLTECHQRLATRPDPSWGRCEYNSEAGSSIEHLVQAHPTARGAPLLSSRVSTRTLRELRQLVARHAVTQSVARDPFCSRRPLPVTY
jgi:hypothetical protein